jgi:hypothetical protein
LLIFTDVIAGDQRPAIATACGAALLVLSAMIRAQSFYFALLIVSPLIFIVLWEPLSLGMLCRRFAQRLWPLGVSLLLAIGAVEYDNWIYARDPEWRSFRDYQALRATLFDFSVLQYAPNARFFYERLGWSQNDYNMFQHYYLADAQLSNKDTLASLLARFGRVGRTASEAREHRHLYLDDLHPYFAITLLNALLAVAIAGGARWRCFLYAGFGCALLSAVILYLSIYAKLAERVVVPAVFALNAAVMFAGLGMSRVHGGATIRAPMPQRGPLLRTAFSISFAAAYGIVVYQVARLHDNLNQSNHSRQLAFAHLVHVVAGDLNSNGHNALFMTQGSEFPQYWAAPSSSGAETLTTLRTISLGWIVHSPYFRAQLEHEDIDELYHAMYERPNVYLFGSGYDAENMTNYVLEHHARKIDSTLPRYYLYDGPADIEPRFLRLRKFYNPVSTPSDKPLPLR